MQQPATMQSMTLALNRYGAALYRLFFAGLTTAAIVTQFVVGLDSPTFRVSNFFSFFTIQSNILAASVFVVTGIAGLTRTHGSQLAWIRGAATFYMATTGIIYVLLLSGLEASLQTPIPWVNAVLHYITPVAVLGDWLVHRPKRNITVREAAAWLIFPALYVVYSLVRGNISGWYPYPFLNPDRQGYAAVAVTCFVITLGLIGLSLALRASTRKGRRTR